VSRSVNAGAAAINLLKIVQHQEHSPPQEKLLDTINERTPRSSLTPQNLSDSGQYKNRIADSGKGYKKHSLWKVRKEFSGDSQTETTLSRASRAGEGYNAHLC